jgi:hypothetical protein
MSRLFRIHEEDLESLERILPEACSRLSVSKKHDPSFYDAMLMVKQILSNVRWDYGPPLEAKEFPCDTHKDESGGGL